MEPNGHTRMGRDHLIQENGHDGLFYFVHELNPWTAWVYNPRIISLLFIGACFLIWASGTLDPRSTESDDLVTSVKRGVWVMIAVFLAYCLLQAPSTVLIRPHPAIWRLVHGMAVVYLVALTFLLFLKRDDARQFMKFLHPDLGVGIWAGLHTVRYFDGRTYEWVGISRQPNIIGKVKQTLLLFTPAQWDRDEWQPLLGPWRFFQVLSLCIVFLTVELNTFFLKFCLWIPPRNPVIVYRLILWWLIAIPTIREYNSYLQDRKPVKKVGAFCWLSVAICIIELLICIKFGHGMFNSAVIPHILSIRSPDESDMSDKPIWGLNANNVFDIKSGYASLKSGNWEPESSCSKAICVWSRLLPPQHLVPFYYDDFRTWNALVFNGIMSIDVDTVQHSITWARYYSERTFKAPSSHFPSRENKHWQRPELGWVSLCTDGAISPTTDIGSEAIKLLNDKDAAFNHCALARSIARLRNLRWETTTQWILRTESEPVDMLAKFDNLPYYNMTYFNQPLKLLLSLLDLNTLNSM
ncbi:hypothetical protein V6N12_030350 [Hibiscus sabdariffa]|uniref:CDP-diacylglycerol--serine O-phosphatidyltransferase n=1 Tax=Hibiscus sabdariffa TaxID=183260 RepID=A0ABR2C0P2_9ROSI